MLFHLGLLCAQFCPLATFNLCPQIPPKSSPKRACPRVKCAPALNFFSRSGFLKTLSKITQNQCNFSKASSKNALKSLRPGAKGQQKRAWGNSNELPQTLYFCSKYYLNRCSERGDWEKGWDKIGSRMCPFLDARSHGVHVARKITQTSHEKSTFGWAACSDEKRTF